MTYTNITTAAALIGGTTTFSELVDGDAAGYIAAADAILAPYGAEMTGNGEIIGTIGGDFLEWDAEEVREQLSMIGF